MTLQASGAISLANLATELSVSATGLSLDAANVRGLAGVSAGAISLSNFYGKSRFPPVNYTLRLEPSSDSTGGIWNVSGAFGSMTPQTTYRGAQMVSINSFNTQFRLMTNPGFLFAVFKINGVAYNRTDATFSNNGTYDFFDWVAPAYIGTFPMSLEG